MFHSTASGTSKPIATLAPQPNEIICYISPPKIVSKAREPKELCPHDSSLLAWEREAIIHIGPNSKDHWCKRRKQEAWCTEIKGQQRMYIYMHSLISGTETIFFFQRVFNISLLSPFLRAQLYMRVATLFSRRFLNEAIAEKFPSAD